jgi:hypothetical protein
MKICRPAFVDALWWKKPIILGIPKSLVPVLPIPTHGYTHPVFLGHPSLVPALSSRISRSSSTRDLTTSAVQMTRTFACLKGAKLQSARLFVDNIDDQPLAI